jgi:hypothetical protein
VGDIANRDRKLARARLVAGEETRSRSRRQHLRPHAWEAWAERYGMEPGVRHLLCFLAASIAQPYNCLERAQLRPETRPGRFHHELCMEAYRLAARALHMLNQLFCWRRPRPPASARFGEERQDYSCRPFALGPFALGAFRSGG